MALKGWSCLPMRMATPSERCRRAAQAATWRTLFRNSKLCSLCEFSIVFVKAMARRALTGAGYGPSAERRHGSGNGHVHHRPRRRHAAGRSRRRCDQGGAARDRRSVPRLQGRPLQPAFPDLQPQQALDHARHQASRAISRASTNWSPAPTCSSRISAPAWRRSSASMQSACRRSTRRLIYCSISGFGPDGPDRERPAFDTVAQAASGFLRLLLNPKSPRVVGPAIGDAVTGFYARAWRAGGAARAQRHRQGTPGRDLDVRGHVPFQSRRFHPLSLRPARRWARSAGRTFRNPTCSSAPTARWLALHMSSPPKFWENLADASASRTCWLARIRRPRRAHRALRGYPRALGADFQG